MNQKFTDPKFKLDDNSVQIALDAIKGEKFNRYIRRRIPYFMDLYRYAIYAVKERWGLDVIFFEAGHEQVKPVWFGQALNKETAELWIEKMNNDSGFLDKIVEELASLEHLSNDLADKVSKINLKRATNNDLAKILLDHFDYWIKYFSIGFLWFAVDDIAEELKTKIKSSWTGTEANLQHFLQAAFRPSKFPSSSREQRELLDLKKIVPDKFDGALKNHWQKYTHLSMRDIDDEPFTLQYFKDRLTIFEQENEYEKAKEELERADKELKETTDLVKGTQLPNDIKKVINFCRDVAYLRTEVIESLTRVNFVFNPVFKEIADRLSLKIEEVLYLLVSELIESIRSGTLSISKEQVKERVDNGYAYLITLPISFFVTGVDVDKLKNLIIPEENLYADLKSIKGQTGFKGKVSGKVRVILDKRKANDLLEGEVLVTGMTNPDFVPAMKRSVAIITNEGGILCHAAIMSREFGVPCVIGTKIATDFLKTGDIVEVDATNGIITKL